MAIDELTRVIAAAPSRPVSSAPPRRDRTLGVSLAALLLTFAAVLPLTRAITPTWLSLSILAMAIVWLAGAALRGLRAHAAAVPVAQLVVWVMAVTGCHSALAALGQLPGPYAFAGVLPTPRLLEALPPIAAAATTAIVENAAPLLPDASLTLVLVAAAGLLALLVDVLAVALRLPLVAVVVALAVWVVPPAVIGDDGHLASILLFTGAALLLLALDRRRRAPEEFRPVPAAAVAALAVVGALVVAPALPAPTATLRGPGPPTRIDATLSLGDDLRRNGDTEVMRYTVGEGEAPYLRVATLSSFDGDRWQPDDGPFVPADEFPPEPIAPPAGMTTAEVSVRVQIANLEGEYLPVPSPLTGLSGVGDGWNVLGENLTVIGGDVAGESYTATATIPRPTREQARAATATIPSPTAEGLQSTTMVLPDSPEVSPIRDLAEEVTGDEGNDYDRLIALQSWFRGGDFAYSLEAPVEDGFDGTSFEAISRFLEVRSGYCVHYASTFAVMARTLGMPSRVVIGYLPGTNTGDDLDDQSVYSVMASQLHAWPEVYFRGIGWVPFEPTPGLGVATEFLPDALTPGGADPDAPRPEITTTPSAGPTSGASRPPEDVGGGTGGGSGSDAGGWLLAAAIAAGVAVLLAVPWLVRQSIRSARLRRAAGGDARAAWRELRAMLVDAGIDTPPHESPRALAARVSTAHGVAPPLLAPLVSAIEDESYGPGGGAPRGDLATALREVRLALTPGRGRRAWQRAAPRALLALPRFGGPDGDG
ncbi:transglutaminase TgpA family protein [Microbacterium sediminis]|uniref:transglutaminase TgpA family protein n=1 Tax=Microbacterium sediminis TaxID=904291 RepID=UPI001071F6BF|nr:DUF3488 and transglutaminase-like domain-containing protein [Microbacterium sediminis]QBR73484.1 DUF4129 domain-containing protein [Microbacterium sediminis]